jgi:SAM-dependent methyltransferase
MGQATHWDNIAQIGNTHFTTSPGADRNWNLYYFSVYTRIVRAMLAGEARGTVLDCGTSFGEWLPFLREEGFQRVVGAEIDPGRAAEAVRRGYDDVFVGDAADAPYPDGTVDVVVSNDVFVHILDMGDKLRVLRRMHELLKPGGAMVFNHASSLAFHPSPEYLVSGYCSFISLDDLTRLVHDETDFRIEDVQPTYRQWRTRPAPLPVKVSRRLMPTPLGPLAARLADRLTSSRTLPVEESDAFYLKLRKVGG